LSGNHGGCPSGPFENRGEDQYVKQAGGACAFVSAGCIDTYQPTASCPAGKAGDEGQGSTTALGLLLALGPTTVALEQGHLHLAGAGVSEWRAVMGALAPVIKFPPSTKHAERATP